MHQDYYPENDKQQSIFYTFSLQNDTICATRDQVVGYGFPEVS